MSDGISAANSDKLDELRLSTNRIIALIEGEEDAPGILARIALHDEVLFGRQDRMGMVTRVTLMWRIHVWGLTTLGVVTGYLLKTLSVHFKL